MNLFSRRRMKKALSNKSPIHDRLYKFHSTFYETFFYTASISRMQYRLCIQNRDHLYLPPRKDLFYGD